MPSAMRIPDRRAPHARSRALAIMVMLACLVAACGGPAPSTAPSVVITPPPSVGPTPVAALRGVDADTSTVSPASLTSGAGPPSHAGVGAGEDPSSYAPISHALVAGRVTELILPSKALPTLAPPLIPGEVERRLRPLLFGALDDPNAPVKPVGRSEVFTNCGSLVNALTS
jgi:hypothetical protein